ncbi:hypothetical protein GGTG_10478 [Gaeumannomyces tritici R3-111a-1]|uniref:Secreted protein n=1 Tax=Gaeumannomyces tritici (strain R3-111a-1) TaxID=644352 RepID=J3PAF2_GAET3|nr:hypothetical protein GGTG_10478 [Gaeumannomyces tritici R3-111a-1]EJT71218.1 hypothetical protein GGTG_10478 [Gaeumannomyces tritici R3-111a-1]
MHLLGCHFSTLLFPLAAQARGLTRKKEGAALQHVCTPYSPLLMMLSGQGVPRPLQALHQQMSDRRQSAFLLSPLHAATQ